MRLASPVALQMDFVSPILQESRLGLQKVYDSWKVTGSQEGFPGGSVVKNSPANAGDTG